MHEFLASHYLLIKALHIISVMAFMAGMLYLPRLFVYHAEAKPGGELSETLKIMERRLLRIIINPAMILMVIFGVLLIMTPGIGWRQGWFHTKLGLLIIMFGMHGMFARWRKSFERDSNKKSARFFRIMNEIPTVIMVAIVLLAVIKPVWS